MRTPFDEIIEGIKTAGFHNQRLEDHSDIVSQGIFRDLLARCPRIADDVAKGAIKSWEKVPAPGSRGRNADLFVGEPNAKGKPDASRVRIVVENKSVLTAHRNTTNRFDDLDDVQKAIHQHKPEAITVATVLIGTALRYLNVSDQVKKYLKSKPGYFEAHVASRLSTGDDSLWTEFPYAISKNGKDHAQRSIAKFRSLPTRPPGQTHVSGYDFVLIVPVSIDNVNPPQLLRANSFGIDIDREYERMLSTMCRAYEARWHL